MVKIKTKVGAMSRSAFAPKIETPPIDSTNEPMYTSSISVAIYSNGKWFTPHSRHGVFRRKQPTKIKKPLSRKINEGTGKVKIR